MNLWCKLRKRISTQDSNIRLFGNSIISSKRGSALLIVLGMLSFMVVSAVGFSVYMRQGRLPSSYLRRNVSSRYLVKAALANAIEELECGFMSKYEVGEDEDDSNPEMGRIFGIYDDPYPGCGPDSNKSNMRSGSRKFNGRNVSFCENGDYWFKRVFCPFGLLPYPLSSGDAVYEPPVTAPTLTTEALAYLPTALIDDVRKVSRLTRTAMWRSLPYEAGRFAYTVVNVSDLFDINRLRAGERRDSGLNRITLATLTSNDPADPAKVDQNRADQLDDIIDPDQNSKLKVGGQVVPFVSLADFGVSAIGSQYAPLLSYFGGGSQALFNDGTTPEHANSLFITDTWFPPTNSDNQVVFDLAGEHQPFANYNASSLPEVWMSSLNSKSVNGVGVGDVLKKNLGLGVACLYDYLDGNSVPLSLDFPTTEPVPMIVAVGAPTALKPTITVNLIPSTPVTDPSGQYTITRTINEYRLTSLGEIGDKFQMNFAAMYPFKRMLKAQRQNGTSYKARAVARVYLMPQTGVALQDCRTSFAGLRPDTSADFTALGSVSYAKGIVSVVSDQLVDLNFNDNMLKEADRKWIKDDSDTLKFTFNTQGLNVPVVYEVSETWNPINPNSSLQTQNKGTKKTFDGLAGAKDNDSIWRPINANRDPNLTWLTSANPGAQIADPSQLPFGDITEFTAPTTQYSLHVSVWVQVVDANNGNKVVDMVPACSDDDDLWLNADDGPHVGKAVSGDYPLLDFVADYAVDFSNPANLPTTVFAASAVFTEWNALFAVDPRFNGAPEDWFCSKGGNTNLKDAWCKALGAGGETGGKVFGAVGSDRNGKQFTRDRDVFMFVSNQEYLQSIGELQFLPWLGDMPTDTKFTTLGKRTLPADTEYSPAFNYNGTSFDNRRLESMGGKVDLTGNRFANESYFWRTYTAYDNSNSQSAKPIPITYPIYDMPYNTTKTVSFLSGVGGFKLNPFSDDIRVHAAAIVNTPFDYYVASTNDQQRQAGARQNTLIRNLDLSNQKDYSFGENCDEAKISTDKMGKILDEISGAFADMAADGDSDWLGAWNDLEWQRNLQDQVGDNNKTFLSPNVLLDSPLHGVDRKYLYSFWRECYDNRQQLFLIFVRAEQASVGGGAAGSVSSAQLGGRAVALVWRDPAVPVASGRTARRSGIMNREDFRDDYKQDNPPHRTRVLFYHQFD